jgi:hypothetical protein
MKTLELLRRGIGLMQIPPVLRIRSSLADTSSLWFVRSPFHVIVAGVAEVK